MKNRLDKDVAIKKEGTKKKSLLEKFYPDFVFDKVENIPYELLVDEGIKLILMDMDNTIIDSKGVYSKSLKKWIKNIRSKDIKIYILSNSFSEKTVKRISKELGVRYYYKASKPSRKTFRKVYESLPEIDKDEILMIGDQLFTDVWGGNRFGIKTLLVKRINKKEIFISKIKRPIEGMILKHYNKKKEKSEQCKV